MYRLIGCVEGKIKMAEIIISQQYKNAVELNQKIMVTAQAAQQNLYDMCVMLKQMRDEKLYKELGYQNFEDYCENEVGISYNYSYKLITIIENVKNLETFQGLGKSKLLLLASLSESQQEEIQQAVNLEETTVRELKAEIEKLKTEAEKADILSHKIETLDEYCSSIKNQRDEAESKVSQLEAEIDELKNRKQITDDKEAQAVIKMLDSRLSKATQDYTNNLEAQRKEYQEKINGLYEQLEIQKNKFQTAVETVEVVDKKEIYMAYNRSVDSVFNAMIRFICSISDNFDKQFCIQESKRLIKKLENSIENI